MKRMKKTVLVIIIIVLATFSAGIAAEAVLMKNEQKNNLNNLNQQSLFDAEIIFYVYEGEGCGCVPVNGASVIAGGEPGESGVTDEEGKCVLTLIILEEYRVSIEAEDFHTVLFDFNVLDDQTFAFHMQEKEKSSQDSFLLFYSFVKNILNQ